MAETDVADKLTSGNIKLPGIGPVKKVYVYVGVGAVGLLAAYLMYRRQQSTAEEAEYTDAELGDGLTTPGAGSDVYQGANAGGSAGSGNDDVQEAPRTNTEYTQRAVEYFNWMEPGYVTSVLGKYLSRVKLSREEGDFVRQVWAALGKPPEGPPTFDLTTDTSDPGTKPTDPKPTPLPQVKTAPGPISGRVTTPNKNSVRVTFKGAKNATSYEVWLDGKLSMNVTGSPFTVPRLKPDTSYTIGVRGKNSAGVGPMSNTTIRTKK